MMLRTRYFFVQDGFMATLQFAERLSELMANRNLTVSELAKQSGVHYVMINRYLKGDRKGKNPSVETLVDLAETLGCSLDNLIGFQFPRESDATETPISKAGEKIGRFYDSLDDQDNLKKLLLLAIQSEDDDQD